jgi:hypothetical protein
MMLTRSRTWLSPPKVNDVTLADFYRSRWGRDRSYSIVMAPSRDQTCGLLAAGDVFMSTSLNVRKRAHLLCCLDIALLHCRHSLHKHHPHLSNRNTAPETSS